MNQSATISPNTKQVDNQGDKPNKQFEAARTRYSWEDPKSLIGSVEIMESDFAGDRAVIHLNKALDVAQMQKLETLGVAFSYKKMDAFANVKDGENVLVVGAFKNEKDVLQVLKDAGVVAGSPKTETPQEYKELDAQRSFVEKAQRYITRNSMRLSGGFGLVGHGALAAVGLVEENPDYIKTAAIYASACMVQILYNNGTGEIDFNPMMNDFKRYLKEQGLEVDDAQSKVLEELNDKRSGVEKFLNLLETHPVEVSMFMMAPGHLQMISGNLNRSDNVVQGLTDMRSIQAITSLAGVMMSVFIEENRHDEIAERKEWEKENLKSWADHLQYMPNHLWNMIADRPVGANGVLNLSDNVTGVINAWNMPEKYRTIRDGNPEKIAKFEDLASQNRNNEKKFDKFTAKAESFQSNEWHINNLTDKYKNANSVENDWLDDTKTHPLGTQEYADSLKERGIQNEKITELQRNLKVANDPTKVMLVTGLTWVQSFAWGLASSMTALTSRNRDPELESVAVYDKLYALAAAEIIKQPDQHRENFIAQSSALLSSNADVLVDTVTIEKGIRDKIEMMALNPFVQGSFERIMKGRMQQIDAIPASDNVVNAATSTIVQAKRDTLERMMGEDARAALSGHALN